MASIRGTFQPVKLTAELVEAFAGTFLSPMYDDIQPTPQCHREWWELYCSEYNYVAIAAPRGHAKSSALTHDFALACALFRVESHILIVSATEELSLGHLGDISKELRDNDDLRQHFGVEGDFIVDSKSEIVVKCRDGYEFRIIARGSGQKLRGLKWNGRRPGLIIGDDMEEDEQVENRDRRRKFQQWVMRALLPLGRRNCKVRWHGTILHEDSMLARIMKDTTWVSRLYKAHHSFDDFSEILWPEMWSEQRLRGIRQNYIEQGDPSGYSQEYLNDPFDNTDGYLRKDDFIPMSDADYDAQGKIKVGVDFAVSKADRANRTSLTVGKKIMSSHGQQPICIIDQYVGRWEPLEWIEVMFNINSKWSPEEFIVEGGTIWKALKTTIYNEMQARDKFFNITVITPLKDKAVRGRPLQKRHAGGGMRYDKEAKWYDDYEAEVLRFTGHSDALKDDQFDSTALLVRGFDESPEIEEDDFLDDEEIEFKRQTPRQNDGRSNVTGY
jgi:hypothetical protein